MVISGPVRIVLILLILRSNFLNAQSITPHTFNNGGGAVSTLEWSMGESVSVANFAGTAYFLNTGVLQPMTNLVTAINEFGPSVFGNEIMVGPNPTSNKLHIKTNFNQTGNLFLQIIDSKSAILFSNESGIIFNSYEKEFDISTCPSGVLYIRAYYKSIKGVSKTGIFKIIKL
jgi:hypothetical protein